MSEHRASEETANKKLPQGGSVLGNPKPTCGHCGAVLEYPPMCCSKATRDYCEEVAMSEHQSSSGTPNKKLPQGGSVLGSPRPMSHLSTEQHDLQNLIARHVMDWEPIESRSPDRSIFIGGRHGDHLLFLNKNWPRNAPWMEWMPWTNMTHAWDVVLRLGELGFNVSIEDIDTRPGEGAWMVDITRKDGDERCRYTGIQEYGYGPHGAQEAICRAAGKAAKLLERESDE